MGAIHAHPSVVLLISFEFLLYGVTLCRSEIVLSVQHLLLFLGESSTEIIVKASRHA